MLDKIKAKLLKYYTKEKLKSYYELQDMDVKEINNMDLQDISFNLKRMNGGLDDENTELQLENIKLKRKNDILNKRINVQNNRMDSIEKTMKRNCKQREEKEINNRLER